MTTIRVRPGWSSAFDEMRKLSKAAHEKANVDEHWALYRVVSGMPVGTYLMLQGSMSLKEEDTDPHTQAYRDALGDDGRAKLQQFQRDGVRPDFWKLRL